MDISRAKKNIVVYKFLAPNLNSILTLPELVDPEMLGVFKKKYGGILSFVHNLGEYETRGLHTLMQFYDPPLRCFVFPDYLLVPTLEEYSYLLRVPIREVPPFCDLADNVDLDKLVRTLYLGKSELEANISFKGKLHGYKLEYLTRKAREAVKAEKWDTFGALLALCIYGIVLFPGEPDFVDVYAIKIFMTKNPVPTLVGDLHYALFNRNEKKRGGIVNCCTPLFYKWFASRLPQSGAFIYSRGSLDWSQRLMGLSAEDISCEPTELKAA